MKRGILIIAVGHRNYLGMAMNLAASIRVNDPGLKIALAIDTPAPAEYQDKLFDIQVQVTPEMITQNGEQAFLKAKLHMLELSPFQETIYLDVDQIMIPRKSLLTVFDELAEIDFTSANYGFSEHSIWADMAEVRKLYGKNPFWNYHAEFMYFKKTKAVRSFFKAAQKVFNDNKIKSAMKFSGAAMADELSFAIAGMITGVSPHKERWLPNYWYSSDKVNRHKLPYQLTDFITYSLAGNVTPRIVKENYQNLAGSYFFKLGLKNPYIFRNKRNFLSNRVNA